MRKPNCGIARIRRERPRGRPTDFTRSGPARPSATEPDPDTLPRARKAWNWWWALLAAPALLIAAWLALILVMNIVFPPGDPRPAVEAAVRRRIAAELPAGASSEQVEQWLKANRAGCNFTLGEGSKPISCWGDMEYGKWPHSGLVSMAFHFDADGKLDGYTVHFQLASY